MSANKLQIGLRRRKHPLNPPPKVRNAADFIGMLEQKMSEAEDQHELHESKEIVSIVNEPKPQPLKSNIKIDLSRFIKVKTKKPKIDQYEPENELEVEVEETKPSGNSQQIPSYSHQSSSIPVSKKGSGSAGVFKYFVLYRKMSTRKNKHWDGDGELTIDGKVLLLKNIEDENIVSSCSNYAGNVDLNKLSTGSIIKIGDKEIEIQELIQPLESNIKIDLSRFIKVKTKKPKIDQYESENEVEVEETKPSGNSQQIPSYSHQSSSIPVSKKGSGSAGVFKYSVLYRKMSTRKNKHWDGDGELTIDGKVLLLKNMEDEKIVSSCSNYAGNVDLNKLSTGSIIKIGDKEIEIQELIEVTEKVSGVNAYNYD